MKEIDNILDRRKRSNTRRDQLNTSKPLNQKAKGVRVYEYYEANSSKTKKPNNNGKTTSVYVAKTLSENFNRTTPGQRGKLSFITARPKRPLKQQVSEVDDLADDQYFYNQLAKQNPTTNQMGTKAVVGKANYNKILNENVKLGKIRNPYMHYVMEILKPVREDVNEDIYDDYGNTDMDDKDVEMYDNHNHNEGALYQTSPIIPYGVNKFRHSQRVPYNKYPFMCNHYQQKAKPKKKKPKHVQFIDVLHIPQTNRSTHKRKRPEQIMITKLLETPDQLHAEIDKIFKNKFKNNGKRPNDKSHWELRIIPNNDDDYT